MHLQQILQWQLIEDGHEAKTGKVVDVEWHGLMNQQTLGGLGLNVERAILKQTETIQAETPDFINQRIGEGAFLHTALIAFAKCGHCSLNRCWNVAAY